MQAVFNQGGVLGQISFSQAQRGDPVVVQVDLEGLDQYTDNYRWSVHDFPVHSSLLRNFPCSNAELGGVFNPENTPEASGTEPVDCNSDPNVACIVGDFTSKHGPLNMQTHVFIDPNLDLFGSQSIVGRSLVIDREDGPPGAFICANIEQKAIRGGKLETFRASVDNGIIQGDVIFRFAEGRDEVTIEADLYRVNGLETETQDHSWSLNFGPGNGICEGVGQVSL